MWTGIMHNDSTLLHNFEGSTVKSQWYCTKIILACVRFYRNAVYPKCPCVAMPTTKENWSVRCISMTLDVWDVLYFHFNFIAYSTHEMHSEYELLKCNVLLKDRNILESCRKWQKFCKTNGTKFYNLFLTFSGQHKQKPCQICINVRGGQGYILANY